MRLHTRRAAAAGLGIAASQVTTRSEPVANALSLVFERNIKKRTVVYVLDFGAGTNDLAVAHVDREKGRVFVLRAATTWGAGNHLTTCLQQSGAIQKVVPGVAIDKEGPSSSRGASAAQGKLVAATWAEVERLKCSNFGARYDRKNPFDNARSKSVLHVCLPGAAGEGAQLKVDMGRVNKIVKAHYAQVCAELFEQVLDSHGNAPTPEHYCLAGGASQAVHLRLVLEEMCGISDARITAVKNPSVATAQGAAKLLLHEHSTARASALRVPECTPFDIGFHLKFQERQPGGNMKEWYDTVVLIEKQTMLPAFGHTDGTLRVRPCDDARSVFVHDIGAMRHRH